MPKRKATTAKKSPASKKRKTTKMVPAAKPEIKMSDEWNNLSPLLFKSDDSFSSSIMLFNALKAGSRGYNRVGRKINMVGLDLRVELANRPITIGDATLNNTLNTYKISLVYDKDSNGVLPTPRDIWEMTDPVTGLPTGSYDVKSADIPRNLNHLKRFTVLKEWRWTKLWDPLDATVSIQSLTTATMFTSANPSGSFREYIKLNDLPVVFDTNIDSTTITGISSGSLFLVTQGPGNVEADLSATVTSRLYFYDV